MHISDTSYDIAVFGSGFCGFAAAITLADAGYHVLLVDHRAAMGWEGTCAYQLDFGEARSPTARHLHQRLSEAGGQSESRVDATVLEMVLDRMASDADLKILYYAHAIAVLADGGTVGGVVIAGKSGNHTIRAKAFVDATESGLLWRQAGAQFMPPTDERALHVVCLNGVKSISAQQELGKLGEAAGVVLRPSMWDGEVMVEIEIPSHDTRLVRRALPSLLRELRSQVGELQDFVLTHIAAESFPICRPRAEVAGIVHPDLANLFAAGPWAGPMDRALGTRLKHGEEAAGEIAARIADLPPVRDAQVEVPPIVAPPAHDWDVAVCGGGTAGPFAAIAAARQGAKTALIEPSTILGGMGTGGGIHSYYHGVPGGIQDETDQRIAELSPLFGRSIGFHPQAKTVVLQQMVEEAGVELLLHTTVTGAEAAEVATTLPAQEGAATPRRVTGVITADPEGSALHRAKVVIDSTGDGDVAFMAGADFTFGRETDSLPHAFSLAAGRLDDEGKLLLTNFDAGYCDPTDLADFTRARRLGLSHYWRETFDAKNRLVYIAPLVGLRNSRQIVGDYRLTLSDEIAGRQFPDVIAYAYSHFDNHGYDYENESDEAMLWVWTLGNWPRKFGCEIPYRCLLPRGLEGLLVACRALSITHDAHNQLRMQRDMQRLGEAAGTAAALAVAHDCTPRALDVSVLQEALFSTGALGKPKPAELPAPDEQEYHESSWMPAQPPAMPLQECVEMLGSEDPTEAAWQLVRAGSDAVPLMKQALDSPCAKTRVWASVGLAMLRQPEAGPELIACVQERRDDGAEAIKQAPIWQSAMALLGRIGDTAAVPALSAVLQDPDPDLDVLIAAIRALGRIADASAAPAIEAMLTREDLPTVRELQVSSAAGGGVRDDALWQIELAAAEALAKMGNPRPDLVAKHKNDERAYVRRYAAKVEQMT